MPEINKIFILPHKSSPIEFILTENDGEKFIG